MTGRTGKTIAKTATQRNAQTSSKTSSKTRAKAPRKQAGTASDGKASGKSASRRIDERIRELAGWRGETLARMRALILDAVPDVTEEWKWNGTPVWSRPVAGRVGIVCTGETYAKVVKLTFAHGAQVPDPAGLFNASLEGKTRRAIDIREGEKVDARALRALVKAAAALGAASTRSAAPRATSRTSTKPRSGGKVVLLSGGNPQIAKGDGDAPVQAYIAAMPGWKSDLGRRLDALIVRTVPKVQKAVRWNSPFYGIEGQGWFLSMHVLTRYVKVTFFSGTSLRPVPPGGTAKSRDVRWIDIYEDDAITDAQIASWVRQAAALPGWVP